MNDEQRAVLRALVALKLDPLKNYKPSDTQRACLDSTALYRGITGVNRGGKTFHTVIEAAHMLRGTHPTRKCEDGMVGLIAVPSRAQAANTQGRYLLKECRMKGGGLHPDIAKQPLLSPDEVEVLWDTSAKPKCPKMIRHRKTKTEIHFIWTDAAKADLRLQGMSFDFAIIDETAGSQALLDELFPRLLDSNGWILWSVTQTKVNMAMEAYLDKCRDAGEPDYEMFVALPDDNPAVKKEDRDRMARNLSKEAAAIRMEGTASALGQVLIYPQFQQNEGLYVRKTPYQWGADDNIWLGYDPGVTHPTGQLIVAINRKEPRKLNLVWFFCQSGMSISQETEALRQALQGRRLTGVVYDACGGRKREKGTGQMIIDSVAERMQAKSWWHTPDPIWIYPKPNHKTGIACVREYLSPPVDDYPTPLISIDPPTPENGLGAFISQMAHYRGREDLEFTGPSGVVKKNDEGPDVIRYLCMAGLTWADHGRNEPKGIRPLPEANVPEEVFTIKSPEQLEQERRDAMSRELGKRYRNGTRKRTWRRDARRLP